MSTYKEIISTLPEWTNEMDFRKKYELWDALEKAYDLGVSYGASRVVESAKSIADLLMKP